MSLYVDNLWYIHYPEFLTFRQRILRFLGEPRKTALRSKKIIASSFSTKDDLVRYWGVQGGAVKILYPINGISSVNPGGKDVEFIKNKYNLPPRFFLFWDEGNGAVQNKKGLFCAFASFKKSYPESGVELLTFSADEIPRDHRGIISRLALASIFPHFYLGSPVLLLEALAAQSPIIASQSGASPEVLSDAAILIDPLRLEELAFYMKELFFDDRLRLLLQEKSACRFNEICKIGMLK